MRRLMRGRRRLGLVLVSILLMGGYLGAAIWVDAARLRIGLQALGLAGVAGVLALSLLNYGLRYLRWAQYLVALGHRLAGAPNLACYLAGFAFTVSPAKAGEAARSVLLREHGVAYADSLAALFVERLVDVLAVCLLAALTAAQFPAFRELALLAAGGFLALTLALGRRGPLDWLERHSVAWRGGLRHAVVQLLRLLRASARLLAARRLYPALALGMIAWAAEGLGLYWLCAALGIELPLAAALAIYSISVLAGAASFFMPGGLGGTEAAMTALLVAAGAGLGDAFVATVLCRLATLWFAVLLGLIALAWVEWQTRQRARLPLCPPP